MKKLPQEIYVKWSGEKDSMYLDASDDPTNHVEQGESLRVGVYVFQGFATIKNATQCTLEPTGKKRD